MSRFLEDEWFDAPLPANVVIGERSYFYSSFAFLHYRSQRPCGLRIGRDSGVYLACCFDVGVNGEVEIGDFCSITGSTFISTRRRVVIGDYVLIGDGVVVADSFAAVPPGADGPEEAVATPPETSITIGNNAWIGWRAVLLGGAHIGEGAIIGAGAVVDFPVQPYAVIFGNPARHVGWARTCSTT